jgi:hypothetical protein
LSDAESKCHASAQGYWQAPIWNLKVHMLIGSVWYSEPMQCYLLDCLCSIIRLGIWHIMLPASNKYTSATNRLQSLLPQLPTDCRASTMYISFIHINNSPNKCYSKWNLEPDLLWIHLLIFILTNKVSRH